MSDQTTQKGGRAIGTEGQGKSAVSHSDSAERSSAFAAPSISLPKGGGAIRGLGEKFAANPVSGSGSATVPIATTPGRSGLGPQLTLSYDTATGNGPFGLGWNLSPPSITRKTDKGLPKYQDAEESDIFILSGAEDLVPVLVPDGDGWRPDAFDRSVDGVDYRVERYRPRVEGLFARIERWTRIETGETHWRSISTANVITLYGGSSESRIADPDDPQRVFSWLICESRDDKGNAIVYEYAPEDSANVDLARVCERNRTEESRSPNRYLKRVRYGNRISHLIQPDLSRADWLFEVVFDYDEGHYEDLPADAAGRRFAQAGVTETRNWALRRDPFSTFRAGFEVRTYRLCRRVLMFHHFPEELGADDYLVSSTEFEYDETPIASFITSITQSGYVRREDGSFLKKSSPPLEFSYSEAVIQSEVREIDAGSLENLPYGLDGRRYQWVDLDGEGVNGILTEQAGSWFYKPNIGEARFGPAQLISFKPSIADLSGRGQLMDLAGDGQLDLVQFAGPLSGFFERDHEGGWSNFTPFISTPKVDWNSPYTKQIDLTGDGHTDILICEDDHFTWYPSLAEEGFGNGLTSSQASDDERGPRLVFADATQSVFLADMSGDGLTDLARIRNGEICYWPNLGYGRFGAKITMDDAPLFDTIDKFDPRLIRLADIDGSGVTDIIYLKSDGIRIYFNQSGNSWSEERPLDQFPLVNNLSSVMVADLLGNGTACLIWSSPLPGDASQPMRYIDLMGGLKPRLMIGMRNNLGAETRVQYSPSTKFYLADKADGIPWITRLPFPVHVVERVETIDHVGRNRFVTRYAYHHGYFDGVEREFRGFGMVEQLDTEEMATLSASDSLPDAANIDAASHVPPVLTKTWFHTGFWLEGGRVSRHFEREYYREPGLSDAEIEAQLLPDTILPAGLTATEEREACRALKGSILRQEVYALDGAPQSAHPYVVSERNYAIERLQPLSDNRFAVFFAHSRETVDYHYERNPADPRVSQALTLEVDDFGNVLRSAAIGYGRRIPDASLAPQDQARQTQTLITCAENLFTNPVALDDDFRAPQPCESRVFELTGLAPVPGRRIDFDMAHEAMMNAAQIPYETAPSGGLQRRLIEHTITLYRRNDLGGPAPRGQLESLALPFESYRLAFTPGLSQQVYGDRVSEAIFANEGGYVHNEDDGQWWIPSGQVFFSADSGDSPAQELDAAREHFFLPRRFRDPFGGVTTVSYDARDLLPAETRDALGNTARSVSDYRVMQPRLVTDPNGNRAAAAFDALGMVVGVAVMGKEGESLGDSLEGFEPNLDEATVIAHLQNPFASPLDILNRASARTIYDLNQYLRTSESVHPQPNVVYSLARETHDADSPPGQLARIQHSFSYSDGFGREVQRKIQAEPGPLIDNGPEISPRWVGGGWTIFNNKGAAVRRYEPFFSGAHGFEFARTMGVSPVFFYDPLGRGVATLHPNHTWEKVVFDPWRSESWDANDTVSQIDPKNDSDIGGFFRRLQDDEYLPTWSAQRIGGAMGAREQNAAARAAAHAETPGVTHFDALGRPFLTIARNRFERNGEVIEESLSTLVSLDIKGAQREVSDARGRIVARYDYDMLGVQIHTSSMESGERWTLNDVAGAHIRAWNSRGQVFRTEYDQLRRLTRSFVTGADSNNPGHEILFRRMVYGEGQGDALNHRGRVFQVFDNAGVATNEEYDFKGNLTRGSRQMLVNYRDAADWSLNPALEAEVFTSETSYDALNRPTTLITPDGSRIHPFYNEANLLERVEARLGGADAATTFVSDIDYNARGQREMVEYGAGARTSYEYDPLTFRMARLTTLRGAEPLQDLTYTYDPIGNITDIHDDAQQTIYFNNQVVEPRAEYAYDAIYRLIEASGREHIGQVSQPQTSWNDEFRAHLPHPNDGQAMRQYSERYEYDEVGNILRLIHRAANGDWTRAYTYNEPSLIEPALMNNRLSQTEVGGSIETYAHDAHGAMASMPHLPLMRWNYLDQLEATSRQVVNNAGTPETIYYVYDTAGQRVRKITERQAAAGQTPTRRSERIYLGGFEIYREYEADGATATLERQTLSVMDDQRRVAIVETRVHGDDGSPARLIRYQFANHLGSASLELDEVGLIVSYEEYYPYGSAAYQAVRSGVEISPKRYRYTGKELDEETGFYYYGARYYAAWLGRWTATDPIGLGDGVNQYRYVSNNPIAMVDPNGAAGMTPEQERAYIANISAELDRQGYQSESFNVGVVTNTEYVGPEEISSRVSSAAAAGQETIDDPIVRAAFGVGVLGTLYTPQGASAETARQEKIEQGAIKAQATSQRTLAELPQKIRESRNRSATWMAIYTAGLIAAPFVIEGGGIAIAAATRGGQALTARALPYALAEGETLAGAMEISPLFKATVWTGALTLGLPFLPGARGSGAPTGSVGAMRMPGAPPRQRLTATNLLTVPTGPSTAPTTTVPQPIRSAYFNALNQTSLPTEAGKAAHQAAGANPTGADFFRLVPQGKKYGPVLNEMKTILTGDANVQQRVKQVLEQARAQSLQYSLDMQKETGFVPIRTFTLHLMRQNVTINR